MRLYLPVLFAVALFGCAGPGPTVPPPDHFIALEHRWVQALAAHDTASLDSLLTDDFIDITFQGGIRSKHDLTMGHPSPGASYHSVRLESLVVRPQGSAVIVTGTNVLEGADSTDIARIRFTDVFVFQDGRWRAASAQETLVQSFLGPE